MRHIPGDQVSVSLDGGRTFKPLIDPPEFAISHDGTECTVTWVEKLEEDPVFQSGKDETAWPNMRQARFTVHLEAGPAYESVREGRPATPRRIQRKREKGWRKPEGAIYVGRGTRWGNPFIPGETITPPIERYLIEQVYVRDAAHAVKLYRKWLRGSANRIDDLVPLLGGRDLMCWCKPGDPCHADVLLELANPGGQP